MEYLNELTSRTKWKCGSWQCFSYRLNGGPEGRQHASVVLEDRSHNLFPSWTRWSSKSCLCENWGRYLQKKRKEAVSSSYGRTRYWQEDLITFVNYLHVSYLCFLLCLIRIGLVPIVYNIISIEFLILCWTWAFKRSRHVTSW